LVQWQERIRENTKSKWPEKTELAASCCKLLLPSPSPSPTPSPLVLGGDSTSVMQVKFKTPEMVRLGKLWNRRDSTKWTKEELKAIKLIEPIGEDDLKAIERYYTAKHPADADYRRRDMITLLNNWNGEVDRARKFQPKKEYNL
jgi:hypothetical protein